MILVARSPAWHRARQWAVVASLGLLGGFSSSPATVIAGPADEIARVELERCMAALDPIADVGLARIAARCPNLVPAIEAASWRVLLPPNWRERSDALSRSSLAALAQLVAERERARAVRPAPDPAQVAAVLRDISADTDDRATRWQRFKRWLRAVLERDDSHQQRHVLRRWIEPITLGEAVSRALNYLGYVLLMGFSALVIWNELQAAGRSARRGLSRPDTPTVDPSGSQPWVVADLERMPLAERPGLLVRLLAQRWRGRDTATTGTALTISELQHHWPLGSAERERFAALGNAAERVRYSATPPSDAELMAAVEQGTALLEASGPLRGVRA